MTQLLGRAFDTLDISPPDRARISRLIARRLVVPSSNLATPSSLNKKRYYFQGKEHLETNPFPRFMRSKANPVGKNNITNHPFIYINILLLFTFSDVFNAYMFLKYFSCIKYTIILIFFGFGNVI